MHVRSWTWALRLSSLIFPLGASVASAQSGSIAVRVVEAGSSNPVDQAQVSIVGTTLGGLTNSEGRVVLRSVAAGTHQLRVLRVGYSEHKQPVTVAAGQQATVDVSLRPVAVSLAPVVTTATGETRRVEIGNAVTNIQLADVAKVAPIQNVFDALNARAPGVQIVSGTQTGAGARVRIRGQNSLSLSNDPIYVIDGVRMTSNIASSNLFTGGAQPSRVGDLNPEEIESIEIVKGPSAATLYGTDAANGVIVITTKRGLAGAARWNVYAEGGLIEDRNTYPTAYTIFGKRVTNGVPEANTAPLNFCNNSRVSLGACTVDSVASLNVFEEPELTPLGTGYRSQFGAQLSGGTETVRYFLAGERENETGVLELPEFERVRFDTMNITPREWTERPNALARTSLRANLNATVNSRLDLAANSNFINLDQRFSLESNATAGLGSQIFGGPGCFPCSPERLVGGGLGTPLNGYRAWTPGYTWQEKAGQRAHRFIGSGNANWRPTSWWQNRLTTGIDFTDRVDDNLLFRGEGPPINNTYRLGFKQNTRTDIRNITTDLSSAATWTPRSSLNFKTTVGAQYIYYTFEQNEATGEDLPPGTQTSGAAATQSSDEATTLQKTLGLFIEEAVAIGDRLFLTAAVRTDQNSAFGTDFQRVFYPKASASWIVSDEGFFPQLGWINSLRLRLAAGASGVQPGPNDALRTFASTTANIRGVDLPAVVSGALGNIDLKPERSTEIEGGFEAKLFRERVNLDVTYYQKKTKDALIDAIVAPSAGSADEVRRNLGAVRNTGWEFVVFSQLFDRPAFAADLSVNFSTNSNRLLSLGGTPPQIGTTTRVVEGYPLFGFWARPITGWDDKNGDGILTYSADESLNEVFVGDTVVFRGYTTPRNVATLNAGFDFFRRQFRVQTMFDYRGGHLHYNNTERIRCVSRQNCAGLMNPDASFEDQAMVVATRDHPSRTLDGFFQDGDFIRFREISAIYNFSPSLATRLLRARGGSLVLTARNLKFWSDYRGVDPETEFNGTEGSDAPSEFQTLGPQTFWVLRVNLNF